MPLHCKRPKVLTEKGHADGTGAPWQLLSTFLCNVNAAYMPAFFIYSDFSFLPTAPVLGVRTGKGKTKKLYIGGPSPCSPWCWDWSPNTNPGPLRVLDSLSCSGLTPGEGRLGPLPPYWPWQLKGSLQMKFLVLKWTATRAPPFSGDFIPQDTRRQNPHPSHMARSVNWKQCASLSSGFVRMSDPVAFYWAIWLHTAGIHVKECPGRYVVVAPEIPHWPFTNHKEKLTNS